LSVASMVCAVDGMPRKNRYRKYRIKAVHGIDDQAMIREVVSRRVGRIVKEGGSLPDLILVDGGITQLNAGLKALAENGGAGCSIIGLAKRDEEIYVPGRQKPLRLDKDSSGLKVLRRLRDEAHRFALEYHRGLRNKRIRDSLLDDVSGVGPSKKKALLASFGSVRRMARASEDRIASVPGIGYKLASEIKQVLAGKGSS
jgi:excinuclease ABC subunit C